MNKEKRIIVPSAKIVPEELQSLGKLPAIIYPVGEGIVFDHLLKQYEEISNSMDIICYEKADKVHRRLKNYKSSKIRVNDLPVLSDLGHTIWYAIQDVKEPIVINFADTIVLDNIFTNNQDAFFFGEKYPSDKWTFFEEANGIITDIIDKNEKYDDENGKRKVFIGVFQIIHTEKFKECLESAFKEQDDAISSFYRALIKYSKINPLLAIKTNNWFDIGHAEEYYNSKLEVKAREFNHITIDKDRSILRKSSDDVEKFIGEIKWYLKLPADIEYVRPRIFSYSVSYTEPYVSMEYYSYHTIHELFLYGDLSKTQWVDIFNRIHFVLNDFKRYKLTDEGITKSLKNMYLDKTKQRFDKLKKDTRYKMFFEKTIKINGVKYKSLNEIQQIIEEIVPKYLYNLKTFNIIHGDLCFANIMVDNTFSFIKLIDPRGKFGEYDIYGDPRYELAKLFHSVDGKYDFIIKDLFNVSYNLQEGEILYEILDRKRDYDLYKIFCKVFANEIKDCLKEIELIESLLFLSMIPLHGESLNHQMVMLATGLEILGRITKDIFL